MLQEREFERVGGIHTIKVDTRVVAATNKHLPHEIEAGRFREDLYYRLNVITVDLPPLRERREDIPPLVEHFLHEHRSQPGAGPAKISQPALSKLMSYDWPGNVRELENTIERAMVLAQSGVISEEHVTFTGVDSRRFVEVGQLLRQGQRLQEILADVEKQALSEALHQSGGDRSAAAAMLGLELSDLARRISENGLSDLQ